MTHIKKSFALGQHQVNLEYGEIGRQAAATVLVNIEDTVVLVAATGRQEPLPNASFLPLTVEYQEKYYAAGRIPGNFFRRESRPSEKETLTARLIDRSLRPLFPDYYYNEIQVLAWVVSSNPEIDADIPAMIGASAALTISGIPFNIPIAAAKIACIEGKVIVSPTASQLADSDLSLVVAGTKQGVLMVESRANQLSEEKMLEAVTAGHEAMQDGINTIAEMAAEINLPPWSWQAPQLTPQQSDAISQMAIPRFEQAYQIVDKQQRTQALQTIRQEVSDSFEKSEAQNETSVSLNLVNQCLKKIEAGIVRQKIISGHPRIDGRSCDAVRNLNVKVGVLPRTHGSALFTRGDTQALVTTTLGSDRDDQRVDSLAGDQFESFLLHYNFPPFATGETGRPGSPKRREIGHGSLAKRALRAIVPSRDDFGFTLRVVSEITESNGSSSMASVCGGSLALMDAGVPIKTAVSGIAMGLIKEGDQYAILSDILGDEDYLGDMDFKVAGTKDGITALQMDLKIDSIDATIMKDALNQAKAGRLHILEAMNNVISQPREEVSPYAPCMLKMKIRVNKIRDVIGKGGAVIRNLTEVTNTKINVEDDGCVVITGENRELCNRAKEKIEEITMDLEVGRVYDGKVENILENVGAIVSILPGRDGLLHISQISKERVERVSDYLIVGQNLRVKVVKSEEGRVRFTLRGIDENEEQ